MAAHISAYGRDVTPYWKHMKYVNGRRPTASGGNGERNTSSHAMIAAQTSCTLFNPISYGTPSFAGIDSISHHSGGWPS